MLPDRTNVHICIPSLRPAFAGKLGYSCHYDTLLLYSTGTFFWPYCLRYIIALLFLYLVLVTASLLILHDIIVVAVFPMLLQSKWAIRGVRTLCCSNLRVHFYAPIVLPM
jgi:hypothetical protein